MDARDWKDAETWIALSELTHRQRALGFPLAANPQLDAALAGRKDGPLACMLELWRADNLAHAGRFDDAGSAYKRHAKRFGTLRFAGTGLGALAMRARSHCLERGGSLTGAARALRDLQERFAEDAGAGDWYRLALLAESAGQPREAAGLFKEAAADADPGHRSAPTAAELARRDLERLGSERGWCRPSFEQLADELRTALAGRDGKRLQALASPTHFTLGFWGGERAFTRPAPALAQLIDELPAEEELVAPAALLGSGRKRYLMTDGWRGEIFLGPVAFVLTANPYGVEWSGVALTVPPKVWFLDYRPRQGAKGKPRRDDDFYPDWENRPPKGGGGRPPAPVPAPAPAPAPAPPRTTFGLGMKAPWPAGSLAIAGGIVPFGLAVARLLSIAAGAGPLFWPTLAALTLAESLARPCGLGFGGLYYFWPPTHVGRDMFAVDFARFLPFAPGIPLTYGTPTLAIAPGIVFTVIDTAPTGSESFANEVHIGHYPTEADAVGAFLLALFGRTPTDIYVSEYLHLDGPKRIPVSLGMFVRQGARLGVMDDTGYSVSHHLHFSLHDTAQADPGGYRWGASVPPVPMDGQPVLDGECMFSTNVPIP